MCASLEYTITQCFEILSVSFQSSLTWINEVYLQHVQISEKCIPYKILVGKSKAKRPFGRHRCRWKVKIRTDLREMRCKDVNCIHLFQDVNQWRDLVNMVMNLRGSIKGEEFLDQLSDCLLLKKGSAPYS